MLMKSAVFSLRPQKHAIPEILVADEGSHASLDVVQSGPKLFEGNSRENAHVVGQQL